MEAQLELSGAHLRAEDLHRIAVLDDVAISPDGRLVAATVRTADIDANLYRSAISIFPVDGSTSWPLTAGTTKDWAPSWSPSGTRLAFLSDRGGSTQVWVIGIHGEARQLTTFPDGVSERPVWSPDGRHLAVVSWQQNDAVSGDDAMASDADASIAVITRTCYRIDGQGYVGNRRHHIWIVDSETGLTRQVTDGETDNYEPAWSPTGDRIVFVSNRVDDQIIDFRSALWVVPASGGPVERITSEDGVSLAPAWSPDGAHIAYSGTSAGEQYGVNHRLLLASPAGEQPPRALVDAASFDGHVCGSLFSDTWPTGKGALQLHWAPDSQTIFFVAAEKARVHIFAAELGGKLIKLVDGDRACAMISASRDGQTIAFAASDLQHPADLFVLERAADGTWASPRSLSRLNPWLDAAGLMQAVAFTATSDDGRQIDAWLLPPVGVDKPEAGPLLLHIHGGPHSIFGYTFFFDMHLLSAQGYSVLFTNPRASRSYGDDFALCNRGRWGEGDAPDLLAAVDQATTMGWVDERRIGVFGLSYGGYMVNWLLGHSERFRAGVSENSISNLLTEYGTSDIGWYFMPLELDAEPEDDLERYRRLSPISAVDRIKAPLLLLNSEADWRCPIEQAEQLYTSLKRRKRTVEMVRFVGESHGMLSLGKPVARLVRRQHLLRWFRAHL